ncbi:phytanoyl-CoA dioxygenase family protein [Arenibacter sp. S6351L]|uniref:phytanoyl-CoA dioxygenase family protein n=1 Tax=Arenibacter sp. S6351L TaxID=2926407 RepID=UPI001FF473A6|nr:phytanoyl-CoA dioxygenase family protein [Arenibacter sp. S6351L]MCK0135457.1 phytanoyl-CoA dioxygenase family protein [Arenibacter sp. S6351L]
MKRIDDLNDKVFCNKLRQDFLRDGYILFPKFLQQDEIDMVNKKIQEFITTKVQDMPSKEVYYEDIANKDTLKQLQQLFAYDPFFFDMMFGSRFQKLASILLDDNVVGKNIQYFNKPAKIGKPTPPHQDGYYFMLSPNEAVTMWMALEPVDQENGCVRYIKGSHRYGIRSHGRTGTLGFSQGITDFGCPNDIENEVFFPTRAGDLLVHHSLTIHRANGNLSERSRKAMGFIYYAEKAQEDKAAHEEYAKNLANELAKDKII